MKKLLRVSMLLLFALILMMQTVSASYLSMHGTADKAAKYVTILVLKNDTDINQVEKEDIKYVDQVAIGKDGTFVITLPFSEIENYDIRSNMKFDIESDGYEKTGVLYVSTNGNDANSGASESAPLATLSGAYKKLYKTAKIVLLDDTTYIEVPSHTGDFTIEGKTQNVKLILPEQISLNGNLTIDNVTFVKENVSDATTVFANGYNFVVGENVTATSDNRINVYGGKQNANLTGDTDIKLLGGRYNEVLGGGLNCVVTGNTNVVLGGNANKDEDIDDSNKTTLSPCMVYGGSEKAKVTGKTNVTLTDNAVAKYLVGAGKGSGGTAIDTNIYINGGKVMNVYAGSTNVTLPAGTVTHATITGGTAEAIFGGCESVAMTGHTFVNLLGGHVTRRVYSGCYNNVSFSTSGLNIQATWSSSRYVTGTTTLTIGPDVKLNTKVGLSEDNSVNVGVFAGSRMEAQNDAEHNTIIYLDNCYSTQSSKIGEKSYKLIVALSKWLKSFEDYTIKSGANGNTYSTTTPGIINIAPDTGYEAYIGNDTTKIYNNENIAISTGTSEVNFREKDFYINSVTLDKKTENSVSGKAHIFANNRAGEIYPHLIVAVYESGTNTLISTDIQSASKSDNMTFNLNCKFEEGKTYFIKVMLWDKERKPLTMLYKITI